MNKRTKYVFEQPMISTTKAVLSSYASNS